MTCVRLSWALPITSLPPTDTQTRSRSAHANRAQSLISRELSLVHNLKRDTNRLPVPRQRVAYMPHIDPRRIDTQICLRGSARELQLPLPRPRDARRMCLFQKAL